MNAPAQQPQPNASGPMEDGDTQFLGVDMRDPRTLSPGLLNNGKNLRYYDFVPQTRRGVQKPAWANKVDASNSPVIHPWGKIYGGGPFRDPNGLAWSIIAADGLAWRLLPYNQPTAIPLPAGVQLLGPCTFIQAFDNVYCFRGQFLAPLRMEDFDDGFEDIVGHWDSTDVWPAGTEVAYGPFQSVTSVTRVGNTVTVVTPVPHGFITGADITIMGANQSAYNTRANITVLDQVTFTYFVTGAPATPATGTVVCSNMIYYWKATGTLYSGVTITHVTTTATATFVNHGFPNGASITLLGATPSQYNGTFVITVTGANTFTYVMASDPGANATGTITAYLAAQTLAGHSPDTNPNDWTRVWNILPNADNALYINNRLLVPTAYEPSSADFYTTFNGGSYKKKDYLVATDFLDDIHFDFSDEFRINQGSADEIVDVAKFNDTTAVVWKDQSWALLGNIAFDLSNLTLQFQSYEYGLCSRGAWTLAAQSLYFMATKRGVVSLRQTELGVIVGVDLPLSAPIQQLINRIDWTLKAGIRMESWNSTLYCAVPLDNGTLEAADLVQLNGPPTYPAGGSGIVSIRGFIAGQVYTYTAGNSTALWSMPGFGTSIAPGKFTATQTTYYLQGNSGIATATIVPPSTIGLNNAMLVYDLVAAGKGGMWNLYNNLGWTPVDMGPAICPIEFVKQPVAGLERLLFLAEDGFVNVVEETDYGDEVGNALAARGVSRIEIETYALSRAYLTTEKRLSKPVQGTLVLQTWNPNYSANVIFSGVNKQTTLATNSTRDNTAYFRPWDAPDWNPTNVNDDHDTPDREDYSVTLVAGGVNFAGEGIQLDRFQEVIHNLRLNGRQGRSFQVELTNTQGRIKLLGVGLGATPGRERKGILT